MAGVKGRSGARKLPASTHQLRGTYRRDRHGEIPESTPGEPGDTPATPGDPIPVVTPYGLTKAERRYWAYFAPLLESARALTPADRDTLADYCRACVAVTDRNRRLARAFAKRTIDPAIVRMLDSQVRGWIEKKTRLAIELGLTAVSRTRLAWTGHHQQPIATIDTPRSKLSQLQERAAALRRPLGLK